MRMRWLSWLFVSVLLRMAQCIETPLKDLENGLQPTQVALQSTSPKPSLRGEREGMPIPQVTRPQQDETSVKPPLGPLGPLPTHRSTPLEDRKEPEAAVAKRAMAVTAATVTKVPTSPEAQPAPTLSGDEQDDSARSLANQPTESKNSTADTIDHVEAQLQLLQMLENEVALSIEKVNSQLKTTRLSFENARLSQQLNAVRTNLQKLASGLNGTLEEMLTVEKDTEQQAKQLHEVLEKQKEEEQEEYLEEHGIEDVDYETGHVRNTSALTNIRLQKLADVEKNVDPAVLHYDLKLLGQIAILFGVAAMGGIVATMFNLPPHVGYLLGGALVGPSCLGVVRQYKEVETISLLGSVFLLFGHGATYNLQRPDRVFQLYLLGGLVYVVMTVILLAVVSVYVGWTFSGVHGVIVGVAVCFTTTAPLYEHIRLNHIQQTSYGRTVTAIIVFQDILMSFALGTPEWFAVKSMRNIGLHMFKSILAYAVLVGMAMSLHRFVIPRMLPFLAEMEKVHQTSLVLLGVVAVCLTMALLAEIMGLSLECGAFLAGLAFMHANNIQVALSSIRVLENVFGSMFFACVGLILNPLFLLRNMGEILSMVVLIVAVKILCMLAVMMFMRISMEKALMASLGLCQIGEFALIFMIKAHASQLVSRRLYLLVVAAIAVFLGCSSLVNRNLVFMKRRAVFRLPSVARGRGHHKEHHEDEADADRARGDSDSEAMLPGSPSNRRKAFSVTKQVF